MLCGSLNSGVRFLVFKSQDHQLRDHRRYFNISVPEFPHLWHGDDVVTTWYGLCRSNGLKDVKCLDQFLIYNKLPTNFSYYEINLRSHQSSLLVLQRRRFSVQSITWLFLRFLSQLGGARTSTHLLPGEADHPGEFRTRYLGVHVLSSVGV